MNILPWIYAARIKTLVASVVPVISSSIILPQITPVNIGLLSLTLIAAIIIQVVTNYINDLYDFLKGADNNRIGPARMLQSGKISEKQMKRAIVILFMVGIVVGIPLAIKGGWIIVIIGLSAFLFAYLYTAGPFALAYNGLGDVFVFIYFGLIAVSGSYYLQIEQVSMGCIYLGISIGCKNVLLLIVNNIRDYKSDLKCSKNTLIVKYGLFFGKAYAITTLLTSYVVMFFLSTSLSNNAVFYMALVSIPLSINIVVDILYKEPKYLGSVLGKVVSLLALDCALLYIGQLL
tara:strand:- start:2139 stop:3008 length:870 start_codon:yes stop_codon:yes gene_type:complete